MIGATVAALIAVAGLCAIAVAALVLLERHQDALADPDAPVPYLPAGDDLMAVADAVQDERWGELDDRQFRRLLDDGGVR